MSYLDEVAEKLSSLLPEMPEEKRNEILTLFRDEVLKSYRNGGEKGRATPAKPGRRQRSTPSDEGSEARS